VLRGVVLCCVVLCCVVLCCAVLYCVVLCCVVAVTLHFGGTAFASASAGPEEADLNLLSSITWLKNVPRHMLARVAVIARQASFPAGQVIVREGEGASL
jgi:hypothetical protein